MKDYISIVFITAKMIEQFRQQWPFHRHDNHSEYKNPQKIV